MSYVKRVVYRRTDFPQTGWVFSALPAFDATVTVAPIAQAHATGAPRRRTPQRHGAYDAGVSFASFPVFVAEVWPAVEQLLHSQRPATRLPVFRLAEDWSLPWLQLTPTYDASTFPPILQLADSFRAHGHALLDVRRQAWEWLPWFPIFYPEHLPSLDQLLRSVRAPGRIVRHPAFDETPRLPWFPVFYPEHWGALDQQVRSWRVADRVRRHPALDQRVQQTIFQDLFPVYHAEQWAALDQALRSFRTPPRAPGVNRLVDYLQFISSAATLSGSRAFVRGNSLLLVVDGMSTLLLPRGTSLLPDPDEGATLL